MASMVCWMIPSSVFYLCEHNACVIRQQAVLHPLMPVISKTGSGPVMAFSGFRHPVKRSSRRTV
ncbi:hypothetical protein ACLB1Q_05025 [Escherichia coli]